MSLQIQLPKAEIAAFCRRNQIRQLSLFGSVLRDDFGPDSDIDVLVKFEPEAEVSLFDLIGMQLELAELLRRPVDLVPQRGLKLLIKDEVLQSAEVVYSV